jgi:cytochrome c oxidase subunit 2
VTRIGARALFPVVVGTIGIVASGCGGEQTTLDPASNAGSEISSLWWAMLAGGAAVTVVVVLLVFVAVLRRRGEGVGGWTPGTVFVAVAGVGIPLVVLAALFAATLAVLPETAPAVSKARNGELTVEVTGRQWFWDVEYPTAGVRTANELHIPVGVPVTIEARTADVIHSFWVPQLNRKIDMIPGQTNRLTLEADRAGVFRGQCSEFCGLQHANMAFRVVAEEPGRFQAWLAAQARPAVRPASARLEEGQQVFLGSACVYCHRIAGTNATGTIGPDLTHLASRRGLAAETTPNSRGYLAGWILDPQHLKPGNKMPGTDLDGGQLQVLLDYLESLR